MIITFDAHFALLLSSMMYPAKSDLQIFLDICKDLQRLITPLSFDGFLRMESVENRMDLCFPGKRGDWTQQPKGIFVTCN